MKDFADLTGGEHMEMTPKTLANLMSDEYSDNQIGENVIPDPMEFFRQCVGELTEWAATQDYPRHDLAFINDVMADMVPLERSDLGDIHAYITKKENELD